MTDTESLLVKIIAGLATAIGGGIYIVRRLIASKREPADARASRAIMDAIETLADKVEEMKRNHGRCVFLDGNIPAHVENWMRLQISEIDRRRSGGGGHPR